jgi:hypothetical protein
LQDPRETWLGVAQQGALLHGFVFADFVLADRVSGADVGMVQGRGSAGFLRELGFELQQLPLTLVACLRHLVGATIAVRDLLPNPANAVRFVSPELVKARKATGGRLLGRLDGP